MKSSRIFLELNTITSTHEVIHISREINDIEIDNEIILTENNKIQLEYSQQTMRFIREDREFILKEFDLNGINSFMFVSVYKNHHIFVDNPSRRIIVGRYKIDFENNFIITKEYIECGLRFYDEILDNYSRSSLISRDITITGITQEQDFPNSIVNNIELGIGLIQNLEESPITQIMDSQGRFFPVFLWNRDWGIRGKGLNFLINEQNSKFYNSKRIVNNNPNSSQIWNTDSNSITRISIPYVDINRSGNKQFNLLAEVSDFKVRMDFTEPDLIYGETTNPMVWCQFLRLRPAVCYIVSREGGLDRKMVHYQIDNDTNMAIFPTIVRSGNASKEGYLLWEKTGIFSPNIWRNAGSSNQQFILKLGFPGYSYLEIEFGWVWDHYIRENDLEPTYTDPWFYGESNGIKNPVAPMSPDWDKGVMTYGSLMTNNWYINYKPRNLYEDYVDNNGITGSLSMPIVEMKVTALSNAEIGLGFKVPYITNYDVFRTFKIPYSVNQYVDDPQNYFTTPYVISNEGKTIPVILQDWIEDICKIFGLEFCYNSNNKTFYFRKKQQEFGTDFIEISESIVKNMSRTIDNSLIYTSILYGENPTNTKKIINTDYITEITYTIDENVAKINFASKAQLNISLSYILTNPNDLLYFFDIRNDLLNELKNEIGDQTKNTDEYNQIYIYNPNQFSETNIPNQFLTAGISTNYSVFNAEFTPQRIFRNNLSYIKSLMLPNSSQTYILKKTSSEGNPFIFESKISGESRHVIEGEDVYLLNIPDERIFKNNIYKFTYPFLSGRKNNDLYTKNIIKFIFNDGSVKFLYILRETFTNFPYEKEFTCIELIKQ